MAVTKPLNQSILKALAYAPSTSTELKLILGANAREVEVGLWVLKQSRLIRSTGRFVHALDEQVGKHPELLEITSRGRSRLVDGN